MTERFKVLASKASVRETVPWVRIPPSPPVLLVIIDFPSLEFMVSVLVADLWAASVNLELIAMRGLSQKSLFTLFLE